MEVRALYGRLSCGWLHVATLATVGSGRGLLGAIDSGALSMGGVRRLSALKLSVPFR